MINPPWLDLHPSHLAQCRQTPLSLKFGALAIAMRISASALVRFGLKRIWLVGVLRKPLQRRCLRDCHRLLLAGGSHAACNHTQKLFGE